MPPRIPDEQRADILADIEAGGTCRGIARTHDVSTSTVRKIAEEAGVRTPFARERTEKATAARIADDRAKRAELAHEALTASAEALAELRGRVEGMTDRDLITLHGVTADKHLALTRADTDAGAEQVASLLGGMFTELAQRHGDSPETG